MNNRKLMVEEMGRISAEEFHASEKMGLVVVLDNVRSLHNVGAVFRTADAYRVEKIVLCGITATPPSAEIHKSALGAEFSVEWEYCQETLDAVKQLINSGYEVLSIEQTTDSTMLQNFTPQKDKKYAVILGNEVHGVQQEVVNQSNGVLELPQYGTKHSLNVSVTAGIIIWHFAQNLIIK